MQSPSAVSSNHSNNLQSPLTVLTGVGPALYEKFKKLGIFTIADLLFHLPLRYQDRTRITPIAQLRLGMDAVIEGRVVNTRIAFGRRRSLLCQIEDDSGVLQLRMFHFSKLQQAALYDGRLIRCFGDVRQGPSGAEMVHPEYQLDPDEMAAMPANLTPVYPSTDGISQQVWRKLQPQALRLLASNQSSLQLFELPKQLSTRDVDIAEALQFLHLPPVQTDLNLIREGMHPYQQRLAFEELLAHQMSLLKLRQLRQANTAPLIAAKSELQQNLLAHLPFKLTQAQQRAVDAILQDCASGVPMQRLVQGDVGSGKTVVAAIAAAAAVAAQWQVGIMAPTEILAEQHLQEFRKWFAQERVNVEWLVGKHTAKQKRETIARLQQGEIDILIGTHAVFQEHVEFHRLGLVIIDEQHRFGVHQRLALRDKGVNATMVPHQLIMTATPIPRTLAMTAYADLDLSVIDELPPGRKPVNTIALEQRRRGQVIERIQQACQQQRQAYWVCTLIEESEVLNCQAAEKTAEQLQQDLPDITVGLIHGRMKADEKAQVMQAFAKGETQLLVATTVIEVGVNVPNASLMVIENPERLGLAQLHQLRGRVGRGEIESHCVLLYQSPLSNNAKERLNILRESQDGFVIAETDLKLRGPGEVLGTRQTGALQFRIADIERDHDLIPWVSDFARQCLQEGRISATAIEALIQRWIHQADYYAQG